MGESRQPSKTALATATSEAMVVDTLGGRMRVRWDGQAQATPHGQLVFFAEFLATFGVPLAQLAIVGGGEEARTALADWHYWVARGYEF